jgi:hypothetical protein
MFDVFHRAHNKLKSRLEQKRSYQQQKQDVQGRYNHRVFGGIYYPGVQYGHP